MREVAILVVTCVCIFFVQGYLPSLLLKKNNNDEPSVEGVITYARVVAVPDLFEKHVVNNEIYIEYEYKVSEATYTSPKSFKITKFDIRHPGGGEVIAKYARGQPITVRYKASRPSENSPVKK